MGFRMGAEALTLKMEEVVLENGLMTIESAYSKNGKTQTMPIRSCLTDPFRVRLMGNTSNNYLFPGPKGKPMHDIRTSFENACASARISGKVPPAYSATHFGVPPRHERRQSSYATALGTLGRANDAAALRPVVQ